MKTQVLGVKQLKALNLLASRMQDNAVRSLFIWAPKKRQRQADSSLRAQAAFLLLGLRGRGIEPSHCHPGTSSSGGQFLPAWAHQQSPAKAPPGSQPPPKESRSRTEQGLQSLSAREESSALRRSEQQPIEQRRSSEHFPRLATRADSHSSLVPGAEVPEGQWFLLMVVWFFSTKAGWKPRFNTWAQTHSGATRPGGRKDRPGLSGLSGRAAFPRTGWAPVGLQHPECDAH